MDRWILLLAFILFFQINPVSAQKHFCGADSFRQEMLKDQGFRNEIFHNENKILNYRYSQGISNSDTIITIPVVVHIIHKGEPIGTGSNLSDSLVLEAIKGLNHRYSGVLGAGPDSRIRFCLAVRDPKGNFTTGINRVDGSVVPGFSTYGMAMFGGQPGGKEKSVKDLSRWPVTDYYNIWIVHNIVNFAGYAYFPGTKANPYDGTAITARNIDYYNPILTHEVGHGLNLYHVFERTYKSCPGSINCATTGDKVCDTPPSIDLGLGTCQPFNPCPSPYPWRNNRRNYMSYCINFDQFTTGQIDRMRKSISITIRDSLRFSKACIPAHTNDAGIAGFLICDSALRVIVKNYGGNTINKVEIPLSVNGSLKLTYKWNGTLKTYESDTFVIANGIIKADTGVNIKCWTLSPNGVKDTIAFNDTCSLDSVYKPLKGGVYTVGAGKADFASLSHMALSLNRRGICGPVVFNIKSGKYNEQIMLNEIRGASSINTITIQSQKGHPDSVRISHTIIGANDNFVLFMKGTDHVTIRSISFEVHGNSFFSTALRMTNVASGNTIYNCIFEGQKNTLSGLPSGALVYSGDTPDSSNIFRKNIFNRGAYGVFIRGRNSLGNGVVLDSNIFSGQTFITVFLANQKSPQITSNKIMADKMVHTGLNLNRCTRNMKIVGNIITGEIVTGIEMYQCESTGEKKGLIANNYIQLGAQLSNSTLHLRGIHLNYCDRLRFIHNTLDLIASDTLGAAFYSTNSYNLDIYNNLFANRGGGYSIYYGQTDHKGNRVDYNNLFTTGKELAFDGSAFTTLHNWRIHSKKDVRSLSLDPFFVSDSSYEFCESKLFNAGKYFSSVHFDIEGSSRNTKKPTIGVLERTAGVLDLGRDTTLCDSFELMSNVTSAQLQWSTGDTTGSITIDSSGTYFLIAKNSCLTQRDSININIESRPEVDLGNDTIFCKYDTLEISRQFQSILWSTDDTLNSISIEKPGLYWVRVFNSCGANSDTILLGIDSIPNFNLGRDSANCDSVVLKAPEGYGYLWGDGSETEQLTVDTSGLYWVEVSNNCGATLDSINIEIYPKPYVYLGEDTAVCNNYKLETFNTDYSFIWNTGDTTNWIRIDTSGYYFALVESKQGCRAWLDSVYVEIMPLPDPDLGNDLLVGKGEIVRLSTDQVYTAYLWSDGSTKDTLILSTNDLDSIRQIYLQVTDSNGCKGTDTLIIRLKPLGIRGQLSERSLISIYPSPASSVLNIMNPLDVQEVTVSLYNQHRQKVMSHIIRGSYNQLNIEHLAPGPYLVVINASQSHFNYTKKIVIR